MAGGVGVCGGLGVRCTARMDESLHDGIHSVSARPISRIKGFSEYRGHSRARWNARSERGEKQPRSRGGSLCQVRHTAGEKLAFPQQASGKVHVEMWAGRFESPTEDYPGSGNQAEVCCVGVPSSDSCCHSCATWARQ